MSLSTASSSENAQPSRQTRAVVITCAVTGAIHTPSMSPYLPITAQEIAKAAIEAAEAEGRRERYRCAPESRGHRQALRQPEGGR